MTWLAGGLREEGGDSQGRLGIVAHNEQDAFSFNCWGFISESKSGSEPES